MINDNLNINIDNKDNIIGRRIKALRNNRKVTQDKLGDAVGLKKAAISRIENGSAMPGRESLEKIANYFDVSVDYLLGNIDTYRILDNDALKRYKQLLNFLMTKPKEEQEDIVELLEKLLKR